jgi:hypothetical protein
MFRLETTGLRPFAPPYPLPLPLPLPPLPLPPAPTDGLPPLPPTPRIIELPRKLALGWPAGVNDVSALGGGPAGVVEGFAPYGVAPALVLGVAAELGLEPRPKPTGLLRNMLGEALAGVEGAGEDEGGGLSSGTKN